MNFCTKCGNQISDTTTFCGHCGEKVVAPVQEQIPFSQAPPPISESPPVMPEVPIIPADPPVAPESPVMPVTPPVPPDASSSTTGNHSVLQGTPNIPPPVKGCSPLYLEYYEYLAQGSLDKDKGDELKARGQAILNIYHPPLILKLLGIPVVLFGLYIFYFTLSITSNLMELCFMALLFPTLFFTTYPAEKNSRIRHTTKEKVYGLPQVHYETQVQAVELLTGTLVTKRLMKPIALKHSLPAYGLLGILGCIIYVDNHPEAFSDSPGYTSTSSFSSSSTSTAPSTTAQNPCFIDGAEVDIVDNNSYLTVTYYWYNTYGVTLSPVDAFTTSATQDGVSLEAFNFVNKQKEVPPNTTIEMKESFILRKGSDQVHISVESLDKSWSVEKIFQIVEEEIPVEPPADVPPVSQNTEELPQTPVVVDGSATLSKLTNTQWLMSSGDPYNTFSNYNDPQGLQLEIVEIGSDYYAYAMDHITGEGRYQNDTLLPITVVDENTFHIAFQSVMWDGSQIDYQVKLNVNPLGRVFASYWKGSSLLAENMEMLSIDTWQSGKYRYFNQEDSSVRFGLEHQGWITPMDMEFTYYYLLAQRWFSESDTLFYDTRDLYIVSCDFETYRGSWVTIEFYDSSDLFAPLRRATFDFYDASSMTEIQVDGVSYYR